MSYSIQDILNFPSHSVSLLEAIADHSDSFKPEDDSIFPSEFRYIRKYHYGFREVSVYVCNLGDGSTSVELVEKEEALLPKREARLVAFSIMRIGKNITSINWKDLLMFTSERRAMVYVQSAYDDEDFIDVAQDAAELLRQRYTAIHKENIYHVPLESMILTRLIR